MINFHFEERKNIEKITDGVICNCCGLAILKEYNEIFKDHLSISKNWGYLSNKDGQYHEFELCEKCYDKITSSFVIPVSIKSNDPEANYYEFLDTLTAEDEAANGW